MADVSLVTDNLRAHPSAGAWLVRVRRCGYQRVLVIHTQFDFYYFWEKRWFFIAMVLGAFMQSLPLPDEFSRDGMIVLTMSVVATLLFVTEPMPLPTVALLIVALLIMVGQILLLGIGSTKVAKSLMTDSVLFIMGSLMLAAAVVKQKPDIRIAFGVTGHSGTSVVNAR